MTIRAILFDAAGTLLHVHPSVGHVYADEAARYGVRVAPEAIDTAFKREWSGRRVLPHGATPFHTSEAIERAWWHDLVAAVFDDVGANAAFGFDFEGFFSTLYERFADPGDWRLYDDVLPALDALREMNVRCAIVSNWDSRLPRLIDRLGLTSRFEFVLTSAEAGCSKPAPGIFVSALERLHVGDSPDDDVLGAKQAGLHAVLVDRRKGASAGLRSLTELPALIYGIARGGA
jgi:putative hydrolase of the HAD superfamily